MAFEIRKEEPPAVGQGISREPVFATLKMSPGVWFRVAEYGNSKSSAQSAHAWKRDFPGVEAVSRTLREDDRPVFAVFARYVGEPKEAKS